jgi:nicotinate dehydrogenase subunit B
LALNSNLYSSKPDNLINIILNGVREPATQDIGFMPAFKEALSDAQIAELARYMRSRYAPGEPAWRNLPDDIARLRKAASD